MPAILMVLTLWGCGQSASAPVAPPSEHPDQATRSRPTGSDLSKRQPPALLPAPAFSLVDQYGQPYGSDDLRGKVWIGTFFFTRCVATCPKQSESLRKLQEHCRRWPDFERIRFISFTVDPERDTPEVLKEYSSKFNADSEKWRFLTGPREAIARAAESGFRLPVSEASLDPSVPITHSPQFALVDTAGWIRGYYDGTDDNDMRKLIKDLRTVLSEPRKDLDATADISVPEDLFDSNWMREREKRQLEAMQSIEVFHDFRFADLRPESGITFVNQAVDDATRTYTRAHYDHGCGLTAA
ncbi:MAG: BsSco, partial [Planctomycetota bacterium]